MIALVTGGTAGIGAQIAGKLRTAGATVYITGRDPARGAAVADALGATFIATDHVSVADNLRLAAWLADQAATLDILVNNVGGIPGPDRIVTDEGHEATLALNYLGPVALTSTLMPTLATGSRIVQIVSSALTMHTGDPFVEPTPHRALAAYARAKQLALLATLSLARQLAGSCHVNAVNPGMAWTPGVAALTPKTIPAWRRIWPIVRAVQRLASPEKAARQPADLALRPTDTGGYYDGNLTTLPARLRDISLQDRAWDLAAATGRRSDA
ncbi:SDR family NAD(P)-dependent oxidoreductase [Catellatospora vulcania]|uniref:SDR family NAD(P)-dependent oxidoreductase n=1 Tax=Catellatospora vulcania TaxID=1460450 RepID=UPI0018AFC27A|nr:SDR family NAD(P)-dependent oxidoreductase [Catellatospora vulcania]